MFSCFALFLFATALQSTRSSRCLTVSSTSFNHILKEGTSAPDVKPLKKLPSREKFVPTPKSKVSKSKSPRESGPGQTDCIDRHNTILPGCTWPTPAKEIYNPGVVPKLNPRSCFLRSRSFCALTLTQFFSFSHSGQSKRRFAGKARCITSPSGAMHGIGQVAQRPTNMEGSF